MRSSDEADAGEALAARLEGGLDEMRKRAAAWPHRPRVFFEEWDGPLISGICWVEELVEIAGGDMLLPGAARRRASARIGSSIRRLVVERNPEVIIASWCGKAVKERTIVESAPNGAGSMPCATATSTRSSRPTSCNQDRHR